MSDAARHILNQAILREALPADDQWEHYLTGMSDAGASVFLFDHPECSLRVEISGDTIAYEVTR